MVLVHNFDSNHSPFHDRDFQDMDSLIRPITNSFMDQEDSFGGRITPDLPSFSSQSYKKIPIDDLEPFPIGAAFRSPHHEAARRSMLKESVEFLFGSSSSFAKQEEEDRAMSMSNKNIKKRKRSDSDDPSDEDSLRSSQADLDRFRPYQKKLWSERFEDLKDFRRIHGHCSVSYKNPPNPGLARWVKRQRYQYKLYKKDQRSAMTEERIHALEGIGFVWDTYTAAWDRRMSELRTFQEVHGHTNVPASYRANKKLSAWVKCQRRQYKLFVDGLRTTLTQDRVDELNRMGFQWGKNQTVV